MGRRRSSILSSLLLTALAGCSVRAEAQAPRIRAVDSGINMLVERGLAHSPTFRRLYEQLGQSDLIVHLERGPQPWLAAGFNQFVADVGARRLVRITLNVAQLDIDAVALLGHELQHAVELANAPEVEDVDGYERLYRRIGYQSCSREPRCFDTVAAVAAGRAVLKELRRTAAARQAVTASVPISSLARAGDRDDETPPRPAE